MLTISNDKLTLAVRTEGGAMVQLLLKDDPDLVNPMHTRLGHFVCVGRRDRRARLTTMAATWRPARQAASADPASLLRSE